ncbi:sigma-70 family RNA polymerase sigma factor [Paenibacillus sp. FSL K6-1230]|uniref:sigma-70 family RNA polymerase sigma factor n=1 Tax=Paenibacillus sp. FSL K6-1230 TaxID=2921603 RepID=UPI0030FA2AD4
MIDGRENGCSEEIAISEGKEIINETEANKEKKTKNRSEVNKVLEVSKQIEVRIHRDRRREEQKARCNELVYLTRAGDYSSYGELYELTVADVYRTVRFLLKSATEAEDLVQEIFIQAYRSLERFNTDCDFRPWLMGIAMRQVQNYRRRELIQFRFMQRLRKSDEATEYDFAGDLVHRLSFKPLMDQVKRLPYKLQQVITLHYLNEYTQEEIAAILDIPLGTVKSRIHAALRKLRQKHQTMEIYRKKRVEDMI